MAVHIGQGGARPFSAALNRSQVGTALGVEVPPDTAAVPAQQHPLGLAQTVTATGVAVHQTGRGGAPQGSTLSPVSPPFFTFRLLLCKCANTTK